MPLIRPTRSVSLLSLAAVATLVSTLFASAPSTGGLLTPPWDKAAHLAFFGIVGFLLCLGLGRNRLILALLGTIAIGVADESYQAFLPTRHADLADLATDVAAALLAVGIARLLLPSPGIGAAATNTTTLPTD